MERLQSATTFSDAQIQLRSWKKQMMVSKRLKQDQGHIRKFQVLNVLLDQCKRVQGKLRSKRADRAEIVAAEQLNHTVLGWKNNLPLNIHRIFNSEAAPYIEAYQNKRRSSTVVDEVIFYYSKRRSSLSVIGKKCEKYRCNTPVNPKHFTERFKNIFAWLIIIRLWYIISERMLVYDLGKTAIGEPCWNEI